MHPQIDEIDIKLIDSLGRDSSTTFVELARQIGISDAFQSKKTDVGGCH